MNPYLPKRKRHRTSKTFRPPAAVFDYVARPGAIYGGHCYVAVQLHFLSNRCGAEPTHLAARRVWDQIDAEAQRLHLSVTYVADEFKLVLKQRDGKLLGDTALSTIQTMLRQAMDAVGVDQA